MIDCTHSTLMISLSVMNNVTLQTINETSSLQNTGDYFSSRNIYHNFIDIYENNSLFNE